VNTTFEVVILLIGTRAQPTSVKIPEFKRWIGIGCHAITGTITFKWVLILHIVIIFFALGTQFPGVEKLSKAN